MPKKFVFGSVSHATLRPEDLIPVFCETLREVRGTVPKELWTRAWLCMRHKNQMDVDGHEITNDLIDELSTYAPPYHYFGAHPGDGSDFGFWLQEDFEQAMKIDGVLKVSDLSEVAKDFSGEVLHVNDHGNPTFYVATKGRLQEVWSQV